MPITVLQPLGPVVGPGVSLVASTNFIGPMPADTRWIVDIFPVGGEDQLLHQEFNDAGHFTSGTLGYPTVGAFYAPGKAIAQGTTVTFEVTWSSVSTSESESTSIAGLQWDPTAQIGYLNYLQSQAAVSGGFTASDRASLEAIQAAITSKAPLSLGLGHYAAVPVLGDLVAHAGELVLTGRGTLTPPSFAGVPFAFGILVKSVDVPAGFGLRDGFVQTFRERVGQFVPLRLGLLSGVECPIDLVDVRGATQYVAFRDSADLLGYDVTPGCTLHCQWVTPVSP